MMQWLMILFKRFALFRSSQVLRVSVLFIVLLTYASVGYRYFEGTVNPDISWADSIWWSIVTMTTVGYGDMFPTTAAGRFLIGFPTMLLGVSILGYVLSVVATAMIESRMKELKGMKTIELKDHILICNYNGIEKMQELMHEIHQDASTEGVHVVIIDPELEELPGELQDETIHFVKGSPMREGTLTAANLSQARAVILLANVRQPEQSDNENLRAALTIAEIAPDRIVCVECMDPENKVFFERAKCNSVVCIASLSTQMVIQELQDPGVSAVVAELTSNTQGKQFYVAPIEGTYADFNCVKEHYSNEETLVIGLRRMGENILLPESSFPVERNDRVVLISASRPG